MERLPSDVADALHQTAVNPYSQFLCAADGQITWTVSFLSDYEDAFMSALEKLATVELRATGDVFEFSAPETSRLPVSVFGDLFYHADAPSRHTLSFLTPASFKQNGRYVMLPDARLILQSLAMKYGALVDGEREAPDGLADSLGAAAHISSFNIRSRYMPLGRVKIPAFVGNVTLSVTGADTLKSYVNMLLSFGEYFGVGIKTSMGMGGMIRSQDE